MLCAIYVILLHLSFAYAVAVPEVLNLLNRDASPGEAYVVDTGYAKYLGNFTPPYSVAYLGVPYAEPPIGDLRFRSPVELNVERLRKNSSVVDARSYPNFCIQGSIAEGDVEGAGTEDCLKVNIYVPSNATASSKCKSLYNEYKGWMLM